MNGSRLCGAVDWPTGARLTRHILSENKGDHHDSADGLRQS